jgi:hypothetical protein
VSGGRPRSSEPSQSRTNTTNGARRQCTTMGQMVTFVRPKGWYDTLFLSFHKFFVLMLGSMVQKKSSGVDPYYLDVWLPAHSGDVNVTKKLVSNNFKCYT